MKASELMLGDFVRFKCTHPQLTPNIVAIFAIVFDSVVSKKHLVHIAFKDTGAIQYNYNPDVFEGVPLTPEILEKNGFVKYDMNSEEDYLDAPDLSPRFAYGYFPNGTENGWIINIINDNLVVSCRGGSIYKKIDSVHELQHAIRLCEIDKEIVL